MLAGCAALNGTVNGQDKTCVEVTITGDSTLKEKLVMWTAFCRGRTPDWHPLEVNGTIRLKPGLPFKIADKNTKEVLLNVKKLLVGLHLTCAETQNGQLTCQ